MKRYRGWGPLVAQMIVYLQCRRLGFDPWVRKIPWKREWYLTPVFLPGESHGQRSLVSYIHGVAKSWTQLTLSFTFPDKGVSVLIELWGPFLEFPFETPWTTALQASLSITNSRSPLKPMSIDLVMPSNHLILCHPLLLLPSVFPSIRVFSNESALCIRWPKYWSFSFNISPSNEHPRLI